MIHAIAGGSSASLRILDRHTNIVFLEKNGVILQENKAALTQADESLECYVKNLTLEDIYAFSDSCAIEDLEDIKELLDHQIVYNLAIAKEGLAGEWGACIGKSFSRYHEDNPMFRAIALSAAGSDARMGGCTMPVVINSGSGNQGLTVSIPVAVYADALRSPREKLYRALLLSNLTAIYIKSGIGYLSAYCGVVTAACASIAGIAYLHEEPKSVIWDSIENGLAICSGIICDGAKASCAAKIAMSLESAFLAYKMAKSKKKFRGGEGITKRSLEGTVNSVRTLAKIGMAQTDAVILDIMLDKT
jgi:L-cysteine desulfidase